MAVHANARRAGPFAGVSHAPVGDQSLAYLEQGDGEPVVFVHGSASDLRCWRDQLPAVGASYRAIAYSRRFARPNPDIESGADDQMLPHVDDLARFLAATGAAPAHLVGHSWGGFVCLLAAIRHPELVRSLVLEEPPVLSLFVSTPPRPRELLRVLARRPKTGLAILRFGVGTIAPAERAFRRGDDERAMEIFGTGVLGREAFARVPRERRQQMRENAAALRAALLGAGFPPLDPDDVRRVAAPALLLTGQCSPGVLRRLTDRLGELLPDAERVEIAGASHRLHEEQPQAVARVILDFLQRRGG